MAFSLAILTFLIVIVVVLAIMSIVGPKARLDAIKLKRVEAILKAERRGQASLELRLIRDELLSTVPLLNRLLLRWAWPTRLRQFVAQAGWKIKPFKLVLISAVAGLGAYEVAGLFNNNPLIDLVVGGGVGFVPFAALLFTRSRRLRAFEKSFPEAIDLLARAVRAGHAFTTGLEMIAQELPEPVAGEFRITFEEQNFGLPIKDALMNFTERIPLVDVRFFVTALMVQKETGGNLTEVLDKLTYVIRERFRILGEVRIKTAQGRMTAAILIALPPVLALVLKEINPEYMRPLFDDPWGPWILGAAALMQLIGGLILWKIVSIEV
ncbi:MAG: type II secretion system F family protein [Terriglobia bacterium]